MTKSNPEWAKAPLLPSTASDLERDLDIALSHIETAKVDLSTLWNPWKCPAVVLPYLAWAVRVDQWNSIWPERTKRKVIAAALDVHRIRGSRLSVERALDALDVRCTLTEWFEGEGMRRGTFKVDAVISPTKEQSGEDLISQVRKAVDFNKPASRHYSLSATFAAQAIYGPAAAIRLTRLARVIMALDVGWIPPTAKLASAMAPAPVLRVVATKRLRMKT